MTPDHKICKACGEDKPLLVFSRQRLGLYGHRSRCKACIAIEAKPYRDRTVEQRKAYNDGYKAAHKQQELDRNREWNRANQDRVALAAFRHAAQKRGATGDLYYLTVEKLRARFDMYAGKCAYCGGIADSFDHRVPTSRGGLHFPSNLLPACRPCNTRKRRKPERVFREEVRLTHG